MSQNTEQHDSDCAMHNEPAFPNGPCDCRLSQNTEQNVRTRDEHTDNTCIAYLSDLMREKMKFSREVKGRNGWQDMPAEVLSEMLREHVEKGDPVDVANFCMMLAAKRAPIAEARGRAEERAKSIGYLFDNPDTGTEYLPYHPIESGECADAENIREATSAELLSELQAAWTSWKEDREEKEKATTNAAAMEARVKELEGALKEAASALEQVKDGERGGYNARNGKFVSLQMSDGERADIIHSDVTAECEGALETARAALTREGGV